jgi:hypothetical protein
MSESAKKFLCPSRKYLENFISQFWPGNLTNRKFPGNQRTSKIICQ